MDEIFAYVNGTYCAQSQATVSIFDRGFLFADAVYEVTAVINGSMVDNDLHLERLFRSASSIYLEIPKTKEEICAIQTELMDRNQLQEGLIYLQVSRGVADRNFLFPVGTPSSLVLFTQEKTLVDTADAKAGIKVKSVEDQRWARRDIKSVGLLAQVLAKQSAYDAGCQEAWMTDENNMVTEGASSTAYIINGDGAVVTRGRSSLTLEGCTQQSLRRLLKEHQLKFEERAFSLDEALAAQEAFITSASSLVMPVVAIDGKKVGDGRPGRLTRRLRELYVAAARTS